MGKQDKITKQYLQNPNRFAWLINAIVFHGKQMIKPENLTELNVDEIMHFGKGNVLETYRDILKEAVVKEDDNASYVIFGIENQSNVNYAMPVRKALYDVMTYMGQIRELQQVIDKKSHNPTEGIRKEDRIKPVITFTVYWGETRWDGPTRLKEMLEEYPEEYDGYIDDVNINLISIADAKKYLEYIPDEKMRNVLELLSKREKHKREMFFEALRD